MLSTAPSVSREQTWPHLLVLLSSRDRFGNKKQSLHVRVGYLRFYMTAWGLLCVRKKL